jgi:hypothetical protein
VSERRHRFSRRDLAVEAVQLTGDRFGSGS